MIKVKVKRFLSTLVVALLVIQVSGSFYSYAKKTPGDTQNPVSPASPIVISQNTTWDISGSPYDITSNITIEPDVVLTINDGVVVRMAPGTSITVNGSISALGSEQSTIVFTSSKDSSYGGTGITSSSDYWDTIDINSTGNFDANYIKFTYGKEILDVQGNLNIVDGEVTKASILGVNVTDTGVFSGTNMKISYCGTGIVNAGQVYLSDSLITNCSGSNSNGISGVRPFALLNTNFVYGERYILKEGSPDGSIGNYKLLALGGRGADVVAENIVNGYNGPLKIGDMVYTETGNKTGPTKSSVQAIIDKCTRVPKCTFENMEPSCPRIITAVLVKSLDVNGRKEVEITGFANFFIEEIKDEGGHTDIIGRYVGSPVDTVSPGINIKTAGTFYGATVKIDQCDKGLDIQGNTAIINCAITNCRYGMYFNTLNQPNIIYNTIMYNNIFGVYNARPSEITLDLKINYWGSNSGPSVYDETTGTWVGEGDKVSSGVDYSGWLPLDPTLQ